METLDQAPKDPDECQMLCWWRIEAVPSNRATLLFWGHNMQWTPDLRQAIYYAEVTHAKINAQKLTKQEPHKQITVKPHRIQYVPTPRAGNFDMCDLDQIPAIRKATIPAEALDAAAASYLRDKLDGTLQIIRGNRRDKHATITTERDTHAQTIEHAILLRHAFMTLEHRASMGAVTPEYHHPTTKALLSSRARRMMLMTHGHIHEMAGYLFYLDPLHPLKAPHWIIHPDGYLSQSRTDKLPGDHEALKVAVGITSEHRSETT